MIPGQLVFDRRLGKVVEIVKPISAAVYHIRPLGRRYISRIIPARRAFLRPIYHDLLSTWLEVLETTGWKPK